MNILKEWTPERIRTVFNGWHALLLSGNSVLFVVLISVFGIRSNPSYQVAQGILHLSGVSNIRATDVLDGGDPI